MPKRPRICATNSPLRCHHTGARARIDRWRPIAFLALFVLVFSGQAHATGARHALLIANATYLHAPDLINPPHDAMEIGGELEALGFSIHRGIVHRDLSAKALRALFREFVLSVADGSQVVVWYSGHGLLSAGQSYLVPTDAPRGGLAHHERGMSAPGPFVPLSDLTQRLAAKTGVRATLFIDACQTESSFFESPNAPASLQLPQGDLAAPFLAGRGALAVIHSASHGQIADDGDGPFSPFAEAAVQALRGDRLEVTGIFAAISGSLAESGHRAQTPSLAMVLGGGEMPSLSLADESQTLEETYASPSDVGMTGPARRTKRYFRD